MMIKNEIQLEILTLCRQEMEQLLRALFPFFFERWDEPIPLQFKHFLRANQLIAQATKGKRENV